MKTSSIKRIVSPFNTPEQENNLTITLAPKAREGTRAIALLFVLNLILVNACYLLLNYFKRDTFILLPDYVNLLVGFNVVWLANSFIFKKFDIRSYPNYKNLFLTVAKSNLVLLYLVSIVIVIAGFYEYSRVHVFGTVLLLAAGEWALYSAFYHTRGRAIYESRHGSENLPLRYVNFSFKLFAADFVLLISSFFLVNYFKRDTFALNPDYEQLLLLVFGVWLITSLLTRKFDRQDFRNIWYAGAPFIKAALLMAAISAMLVFAFRLFEFSRLQLFGSFVLLLALETVAFMPFFMRRLNKPSNGGDVEEVEDVKAILRQELLPLETEQLKVQFAHDFREVRQKLHDHYLKSDPKLFDMLDRHLDLRDHDERQTVVLNTHTMYNIEVLGNHTLSLIANLQKVNGFRWLNRYFLEVHKKIYNGGYFIGRAHTIETHKKFIYRKYPKFIARVIYPLDFTWHRIFPKMPVLKHVYFFITRGRNRVLSKAEILGRLSFCGFKIVATEVFNENLYFVAQRRKTPSLDRNPSYGPTIKLRRVGLDGKIVYIHKLRTMHPYSEYLQDYIYEQNKLNETGKFLNDFRLTEWGNLFRKFWIDELPQLVNYFRGEINLVGVRALSEHYFSLYPEDVRALRTQFKPGLVPPYYADMPKSFDEIVESERRYLLAKKTHPLSTDIKYFFKAMKNIFFKNARSM